MDLKWEPESNESEIEISSENMDLGVSDIEMSEQGVSEDEVLILEPSPIPWLT
jgi:hypothetical protein